MSRVLTKKTKVAGPNVAFDFSWFGTTIEIISQDRSNRLASVCDFVASLDQEWAQIKLAELERNRKENHHYSPLRHITIKETDHSKLLGELLDPNGSHGQGPLFLESFLTRIGIHAPAQGTWNVTVELGRIDILMRRDNPQSVVIIENKANDAEDQDGQLYRYWFSEIYSRNPNLDYSDPDTAARFKIIYAPALTYSRPIDSSLQRPSDLPGAPVHKVG